MISTAKSSDSDDTCNVDTTMQNSTSSNSYFGTYDWSEFEQSNIIGGYAFGMLFFTIPAGVLLDKFGAKSVFTFNMALNSIATLLCPIAAEGGQWWLFAVRFLDGISGGLSVPAIMGVATRWSPTSESGIWIGFSFGGFSVGTILVYIVSGPLFCGIGPGTWKWSFYFWGGLNALFTVIFWLLYTDDPAKHKYISQVEMKYVLSERNMGETQHHSKVAQLPWRHIFTSPPVLAVLSSNFTAGWAYYFVSDYVPTYSKEILKFDSASNGLYSALPALSQFLGRLIFGTLSDRLNCLKPTLSVKLFDAVGLGVPLITFLVITQLSCESASMAVLCFVLSQLFYCSTTGGYLKSTYKLAPSYMGVISSIGETTQAISSLVVPYTIGKLTSDATATEWHIAFFVTAGVCAVGILIFAIFGSGEVQDWADKDVKSEKKSSKVSEICERY